MKKITLINSIIDLGNENRVATFKAQAVRNPQIIRDTRENFEKMEKIFQELLSVTRLEENIKEIKAVKAAAEAYQEAMNALLENWETLQKVGKQRGNIADQALKRAWEAASKGMDETEEIAEGAVSSLSDAFFIVVIGLIAAVVAGAISAVLITRSVTGPLNKVVAIANEIAEGELGKEIEIRQKDEIGKLADAFRNMKGKIRDVLKETDSLIQAAQNGRLDTRGDETRFSGSWGELVRGVNQLIEAFVDPINVTAVYIDRIAKGDIPEKITDEYQGDFNQIRNNLNMLIDAMNEVTLLAEKMALGEITAEVKERSEKDKLMKALNLMKERIGEVLKETHGLIQAVQEGKLKIRGNAGEFSGAWGELVTGLNLLVDAFVSPINVTAEYIDRIAKGDTPEKITESYKGDFNRIRKNLNMLIDGMNEVVQLAESMADGNLTVEVRERSEADKLMQALNLMIGKLNEVVINVKTVSHNVASGSQELSVSSERVSNGSSQQAASAEEVSASMEEMASTISQNADNASETNRIARKSADAALDGGKTVSETVTAMKQIAEKISIIEDIARQTDLLALNAAIEAARAGEQGKGFAVVASEVRRLAERSQKAAGHIIKLSASSVEIAENAGEMLEKLVPDIQKTAELVQEIAAASEEQRAGSNQVNKAIQQLDLVIQQNVTASEEMAATSEELSSQAEYLRGTIEFFKVGESALKAEEAERTSWSRMLKRKAGKSGRKKTNADGVPLSMTDEDEDEDVIFERY